MAATQNSIIADKGEITITIDAAAATATGLPAGTYNGQIVMRRFRPTEEPERRFAQTNVTGGTIDTAGDYKGVYRYEMLFVDDYVKGATGELGTTPNEFTWVELIEAFVVNNYPIPSLSVTPGGNSTGMIEYTATDVEALYLSGPGVDADAEDPEERTARFGWNKDNFTKATHA